MAVTNSFEKERFRSFNYKDRISESSIKEFEERYESLAQIPMIADGFLGRSVETKTNDSNNFNTNTVDAAYIIQSQKNLRQVE